MKVLLISPLQKIIGHDTLYSKSIASGILYLAASVKASGHKVFIEYGNNDNIIQLVNKHTPDIIGITCITASYPLAKKMIFSIKKEMPEMLIIFGGQHPIFYDERSIFRMSG